MTRSEAKALEEAKKALLKPWQNSKSDIRKLIGMVHGDRQNSFDNHYVYQFDITNTTDADDDDLTLKPYNLEDGRWVKVDIFETAVHDAAKEKLRQPWQSLKDDIRALTVLTNGNLQNCLENRLIYQYDSTSEAEDDDKETLKPDSISEDDPGRWIHVDSFPTEDIRFRALITIFDGVTNPLVSTRVSNNTLNITLESSYVEAGVYKFEFYDILGSEDGNPVALDLGVAFFKILCRSNVGSTPVIGWEIDTAKIILHTYDGSGAPANLFGTDFIEVCIDYCVAAIPTPTPES